MYQQTKTQVSGQEIADILRRVGRGEVTAKLLDPRCTWNWVYAGNVAFEMAGYQIVVFNDCDELDYVDSVVTPDDRLGDFTAWYLNGEEPVSLLNTEEKQAVTNCLKAAI